LYERTNFPLTERRTAEGGKVDRKVNFSIFACLDGTKRSGFMEVFPMLAFFEEY